MNSIKKCLLPVLIISVTFLVFHFCRVIPVTKLWKNYTVLYVSNKCSYKTVKSLLEESGCSDFIYLENQKVPLGISEKTPEVSLACAGMVKNSYLSERENYFYDKNRIVKLYYIPENQEKNLTVVIEHLNSIGFVAGKNTKSVYPWCAILVFVGFSVLLLLFSQNKKLFLALIVPAFYFLINVPFYSIAASLSLFMVVLFIISRFYDREGSISVLLGNVFLLSICGTSFLLALVSNIKFALFFIMLVCTELSIFYLSNVITEYKNSKYSFRPVKIRSAKMIPIMTKKTGKLVLYSSAACFLILVSSFFSVNIGSSAEKSNLILPSCRGSLGRLPDLEDYVNWKWESMTYPYRSLNKSNYRKTDDGDTVYFKSYNKKDGIIEETVNSISFNEDFKKEAINGIEKLGFNSIEDVLKQQTNSKGFGFAASGSQSNTLLSLIFMVFSCLLPLFFYFNIRRWR